MVIEIGFEERHDFSEEDTFSGDVNSEEDLKDFEAEDPDLLLGDFQTED